MKRTILCLTLFLACGACGGSPPVRAAAPDIPPFTVEKGSGSFFSQSGEERAAGPILVVFTSEGEFAAFWERHHGNRIPLPPLPPVDFGRFDVLAVLDVVRPTGGYGIEVTEVAPGPEGMRVSVRLTRPGRGCVTTQSLTQPFHLVRVAKGGAGHRLAVTETIRDCLSP